MTGRGASTALTIVVYGTPAPQGSKNGRPIYRGRGTDRVFSGKVAQVESSVKVKPWREAVKAAALTALALGPEDEQGMAWRTAFPFGVAPVALHMTFVLARPKGHWRTGRNAHLLRDFAPPCPAVKPDLDKLIRSTCDALTDAGVYRDDSQVVEIAARKVYPSAATLATPSALIRIEPRGGAA